MIRYFFNFYKINYFNCWFLLYVLLLDIENIFDFGIIFFLFIV